MKECLSCVRIIFFSVSHADLLKELFYNAFHREEISAAVHTQSKLHALIRKFCQRQRLRNINVAQFIQADILVPSIIVRSKRSEHSVQRARPHDTVVLAQRVHDLDRISQRRICRKEQLVKYLRALERVSHSLAESAEFCDISCHLLDPQLEGELAHRGLSRRKSRRDIVISVESRHFFRKVRQAEQIVTESRSDHFLCLSIIAQIDRLEVSQHLFLGNVRAKQFIDLLRVKRNSHRLLLLSIDINDSADYFACSHLFNELAGTVDRCLSVVRVKPFLEFGRSVCSQTDPLAGLADVHPVEAGRLKEHGLHIVCDHGVLSSHDPRNADLLLAVADHEHILVHCPLLSVQCDKFVSVLRCLYDDMMIRNGIQIISVHGLSVLFHHIVCNIHKVVDRTDSHGGKPSLHPLRRRSDLDVLHHSCAVAGAEICIFNSYFNIVVDVLVISRSCHDRRFKFLAECSCRFSRDPDDAEAVHTVGCDLILKDRVIQAQRLDRALAHNCVFREDIDSVLRRFRIHLSRGAELFDRAHHTITLHAAEFSLLDFNSAGHFLSGLMSACNTSAVQHHRHFVSFFHIRSPCNDLDRLCPDVHLTDDQLVCIRMLLYFIDLSDHDLVKIRIQLFISLYLCSGKRHRIRVLLCSHVEIRNICFYP